MFPRPLILSRLYGELVNRIGHNYFIFKNERNRKSSRHIPRSKLINQHVILSFSFYVNLFLSFTIFLSFIHIQYLRLSFTLSVYLFLLLFLFLSLYFFYSLYITIFVLLSHFFLSLSYTTYPYLLICLQSCMILNLQM